MIHRNRKEIILFLGPKESYLLKWLKEKEESVFQTMEKVTPEFINQLNPTFLISYGYRYILKKDVLDKFPGKAINLHISYLPWNRGADPNFWSFVENSPKGVTIHHLDEGIDTGDIIVQKRVFFKPEVHSFSSTYRILHFEMESLFKENWQVIKSGNCPRMRQRSGGSFHAAKDKKKFWYYLTKGWDTPISELDIIFKQKRLESCQLDIELI